MSEESSGGRAFRAALGKPSHPAEEAADEITDNLLLAF